MPNTSPSYQIHPPETTYHVTVEGLRLSTEQAAHFLRHKHLILFEQLIKAEIIAREGRLPSDEMIRKYGRIVVFTDLQPMRKCFFWCGNLCAAVEIEINPSSARLHVIRYGVDDPTANKRD